MVSVSSKYQVTIPKNVREDMDIHSGDKVVFVKNNKGKWILMIVKELTSKMLTASEDIENTITESKKGFNEGFKKSRKSLDDK
jgi:AbrB family looped-hinge helix DNA binding protein